MSTNSKKYVLDSWAWIAYLDGTEEGKQVDNVLLSSEAFTSAVTVAEVLSKAERQGKDTVKIYDFMVSLSKIIDVDSDIAKAVGQLHAHVKKNSPNFSLADAFALQAARRLNAKVLTGDPDFKGIKEAEML